MKVSKAVQLWIDYHKSNSRKNTVQAYEGTISKFVHAFSDAEIAAINTEDVQSFLDNLTEGRKQQTKKIRYSHVKAFYSFTKANLMPGLESPCDNPMICASVQGCVGNKIIRLGGRRAIRHHPTFLGAPKPARSCPSNGQPHDPTRVVHINFVSVFFADVHLLDGVDGLAVVPVPQLGASQGHVNAE